MSDFHRSVLAAEIVVESTGTADDHSRIVRYVADVTKNAAKHVKGGAVLSRIADAATGRSYGFAGHGEELSGESRESVEFLFEQE